MFRRTTVSSNKFERTFVRDCLRDDGYCNLSYTLSFLQEYYFPAQAEYSYFSLPISRYIVHVLHRSSLQSVYRSRYLCHVLKTKVPDFVSTLCDHCTAVNFFNARNYILFTISASGLLFLKANFSLYIFIKKKECIR